MRSGPLPRLLFYTIFAILCGLAATAPLAAQTSMHRVQSSSPREGDTAWGQDNCFYVFKFRGWRWMDYCRVIRGAGVYDTFKPSTGAWVSKIDESQRGWIAVYPLNTAGATWWRFATNGTAVHLLVNGQWHNVTSRPGSAGATAPSAGLTGTCPVEMPMYGPLTADQRYCNQKMAELINGINRGLPSCASFSSQPRNPDGTIADGWFDTVIGPRRRDCR